MLLYNFIELNFINFFCISGKKFSTPLYVMQMFNKSTCFGHLNAFVWLFTWFFNSLSIFWKFLWCYFDSKLSTSSITFVIECIAWTCVFLLSLILIRISFCLTFVLFCRCVCVFFLPRIHKFIFRPLLAPVIPVTHECRQFHVHKNMEQRISR